MIQEASSCEEVVRFYGVTFYEGDCLICMEYLDISLDKLYKIVHRIAGQAFNEDVLGIVGITILKALNNLKSLKHIIHRGAFFLFRVLFSLLISLFRREAE